MMRNDELVIADQDYARLSALESTGVLADELSRATVIPVERVPADVVRMHSLVTYVVEALGERRQVQLVFPDESDPASGKISVLAPVGAALLGLRAGQSIDWPFPDGQLRRLCVERTVAPTK
jgi:regulator of nucleoside diphosphate kinase